MTRSNAFANYNIAHEQEMIKPHEFIKGKVINHVIHKEDLIHIYFKDEQHKLLMCAYAECCSQSWFENFGNNNFNELIGKELSRIECAEETIELPDPQKQEHTINTIVKIYLENENPFDFVLRNSSNGYYSGWLEMTIIKNTTEETIYGMVETIDEIENAYQDTDILINI